MATILIKDQVRIPYTSVSVAQINEALATYPNNQTIQSGLTELKNQIIASINDAQPCVQCGGGNATGKITVSNVVYICPLCSGQTKTAGQYIPEYPAPVGYKTLE